MKTFLTKVSLIILSLSLSNSSGEFTSKCTLTNIWPNNPFPNLSKCYKYNENACCTILHDEKIREYTESFITPACLRKYPEFEDLLCLGCAPLESVYADSATETIKICKDFAMKLWNVTTLEGLNEPSTRFDNCGLLLPDDRPDWINFETGDGYIIPSFEFKDFYEFVEKIGIPYYDDYSIQVIEGGREECFTVGGYIAVNYITLVLILIGIII